MKITLSTAQAIHHLDNEHFSYWGAQALVEYLEQLEAEMGEELELDPIALWGQYTEYENHTEAYQDLFNGEEITEEDAQQYFEAHTSVITFDDGIIIDNDQL